MKTFTKFELSDEQRTFLTKIARKNWAFFRTFVGDDDNWLPIDNFQEQPAPKVAHKTSPTNIGYALLANLAAFDFGYVTLTRLIERVANTFDTMDLLERYRGHFYNWYDTQSLSPLKPIFISTVDSGNLAGCLLTLRAALLTLPEKEIIDLKLFTGLQDTLTVLNESLAEITEQTSKAGLASALLLIAQFKVNLQSACQSPLNLIGARRQLDQLTKCAGQIVASIDDTTCSEAHWWAQILCDECLAAIEHVDFLLPWITLLPSDKVANRESPTELLTMRYLADLNGSSIAQLSIGLLRSTMSNISDQSLKDLEAQITVSSDRARAQITAVKKLACRSSELAHMEYDFLFDPARKLLAIGYHLDENRLASSRYDLLASEVRLCYFVAIAQGQIPEESWFALGRDLTTIDGQQALLSWGGSMLEYLMPLLVMPVFDQTLLSQTYQAAVKRQIEYGNQCGIPWGMSACCYNAMNDNQNYRYSSFGTPGLGLKPQLADDLVIAPHATALALMVAPEVALQNLERLSVQGFMGKYGFYEAIDYTPARVPAGQSHVIVRSFMAHHQGMTLLSLSKILLQTPMQELFESDPYFQAIMPLLQEPASSPLKSFPELTVAADQGIG